MSKLLNQKHNTPTIFTIFGATGDLSRRKLMPALLDLYQQGLLPESLKIVSLGRRAFSDKEYRAFVKESIQKKEHGYSNKELDNFLELIVYHLGDFTAPESYKELSEKLISIEDEFGQCSNKLFYLAVPPSHYSIIFRQLADSGLTVPCSSEEGWTRILVEKPFGKDIKTAKELDKTLKLLFKEDQIFRIDHYLGKETLQDILTFRFSNLIFEPVWNNKYIERVEITLHENIDIQGRGSFYDGVGALRDVGQNHILQMLALVAMEEPESFNAKEIRGKRADALKDIELLSEKDIINHVVRGQYDGYLKEDGVSTDSQTETYFKIKAFVNNKRWKGVPFYLESGKALDKKKIEINIYFKESESCFCPKQDIGHRHTNILTFRIQPDAGISVVFWARKSGFTTEIEAKELSFSYKGTENEKNINEYERILFNAIIGDRTLFTSTEEVTAAWEFITSISKGWDELELHKYDKGSIGPKCNI